MKFCPNCGKGLDPAETFCGSCGAPADGNDMPAVAGETSLATSGNSPSPTLSELSGPDSNRVDPGAKIRDVGLFLFVLLVVGGIVAIVAGGLQTEVIESGYFGSSRVEKITEAGIRTKAFGHFLCAFAGAMILPVLSFAAWKASKIRCQQAKRAFDVGLEAVSGKFSAAELAGSVKGWATWWYVSAFLSAFGTVVSLLNVLYPDGSSTSAGNGDSSIAEAFANGMKTGFWEASASQFCMLIGCASVVIVLSFIWATCLKDCASYAEETARQLRIRARGEIGQWRRKQIESIVAGMVPIPGKPFLAGKFQTTQGQWEAVTGQTPSEHEGDDLPVENVSWDDCQDFLKKLNALPAVRETGLVFRLPTEEEWKFACRAGATGDYCRLPDGTDITEDMLDEVAWFLEYSVDGAHPHPVGRKKPNAFGLFDMHGNVFEWTSTATDESKINLGGSYCSPAQDCKASKESSDLPSTRYGGLGLRLFAEAKEGHARIPVSFQLQASGANSATIRTSHESPPITTDTTLVGRADYSLSITERGLFDGNSGHEDGWRPSDATVITTNKFRIVIRCLGCFVVLALVMAKTTGYVNPQALLILFCILVGSLCFFLWPGKMPGMVLDSDGLSIGTVRIPWTEVIGFQKKNALMSQSLMVQLKNPATFAVKLGSGVSGWGIGRPFRFSGERIVVDAALLNIKFDRFVTLTARYFAKFGHKEPVEEKIHAPKKREPHRIKVIFPKHVGTAETGVQKASGDHPRNAAAEKMDVGKMADES